MDIASLLFLLLFLFTSATSIPLHDSEGASRECLSVVDSESSTGTSRCHDPTSELSPRFPNEEDDDEEAKWRNRKPYLPVHAMPAGGSRSTAMPATGDGQMLEEDGIIFESGRRNWDYDDAGMLVVVMVFAFLCVMVGTEMVRRIDRRITLLGYVRTGIRL